MAVRIRLKRMGRRHRPFFRVCAMDARSPRDGRVIEELGTYDPTIRETDARARLNHERIAYWLSVGAQPTEKVGILIKKYGPSGTHLEQQQAALDRLAQQKRTPVATAPAAKPEPEAAQSSESSSEPSAEAPVEQTADQSGENTAETSEQ